jgi:hypothetical protein
MFAAVVGPFSSKTDPTDFMRRFRAFADQHGIEASVSNQPPHLHFEYTAKSAIERWIDQEIARVNHSLGHRPGFPTSVRTDMLPPALHRS